MSLWLHCDGEQADDTPCPNTTPVRQSTWSPALRVPDGWLVSVAAGWVALCPQCEDTP